MNPFDIGDWPNRVHFAPGGVAELGAIAGGMGVGRALVVCGRTVAEGDMLARVRAGLGDACAGVFDRVAPQNPLPVMQDGTAMAREVGADALVGVGGGSALDAAKCIALLGAVDGELEPYTIEYGARGSMAHRLLGAGVLPQIAVPTTAGSSSEVMPTAGCRDPERKKKLLFWDSALVPKVVVLDPEMAVFASPELTAHSGMTAMARCIEALYSAKRQPISTGLALEGARLLRRALPRSVAAPDDIAARADCQIGCLMSGVASINAMASVVHAVGHVVGGRFGLQHGVAHSLLLPPAMRLLLPAIGDDRFVVSAALGGAREGASAEAAAEDAARSVETLIAALPLPQRLREVGIAEDDLAGIAETTMGDYMIPNAPRRLTEADVLSILRRAW